MAAYTPKIITSSVAAAFLLLVIISVLSTSSPIVLGLSLMGSLACIAAFIGSNKLNVLSPSLFGEQQLSHTLLAYVEVDSNGKIIECSDGLLNLTQTSKQEILGKSLNQLAAIPYQDAILTNQEHPIAFQLRNCDNKWFEVTSNTYGQQNILLLNDVSDRVRADTLELVDAKTGFGNQRAYDKELPQMLAKAQRSESYLTLAIINLDFFNEFNTSYGHEEGNQAIAKIADAIKHQLRRPTDHHYRLNGDEFVVVFEHDSPNVCRRALEKVLQTIENQHLPQQNSPVSAFVTASIGAFGARGKQLVDVENLYMTADLQLFKAKHQRNSLHSFFPNETVKLDPTPLDEAATV